MMNDTKSQDTEVFEFCPLCCGVDFELYHEDRYPIVKCHQCDLIFVNPRPSFASIRKMFANEYIDTEARVEEHFVSFRKKSLAREAAILKGLLPGGGSLLDIGTASGEFLENFKQDQHWKITGVEPSKFAAEAARQRTGADIKTGFLDEQDLPDHSFDAITSLDTFCLHSFPDNDLQEMNRLLKPGGLLMIEIPGLNFRLLKNKGLLARLIYGDSKRLNAGVHLFYFNRKTLSAMVVKNGFKPLGAYPEQSPLYGNKLIRLLNDTYFNVSKTLYNASNGVFNIVPKELLIYQKDH